jgi:hypothetical protein
MELFFLLFQSDCRIAFSLFPSSLRRSQRKPRPARENSWVVVIEVGVAVEVILLVSGENILGRGGGM